MDSGEGGYDFIRKLNKKINIKTQFVKIFNTGKMVSEYNKEDVRKKILQKINISEKNGLIIIACHSASSTILDILIKKKLCH